MSLEDVTVLDLGDLATASASGILAELGASVVRVEDSEDDAVRRSDAHHRTANAGKTSIAVDFRDPAWMGPILEQIANVDVVVGPLDPDHPATTLIAALQQLGADQRPAVVETVFRRGHPNEVATDLIIGAASGQLVLNGHSDDPPNHPAGELAYDQTALAVAEAALALVLARRRTGHAGHVVVSAQEAMGQTTFQSGNGNFWHWHHTAPSRHQKLAGGTTMQSRDGRWTSFTIHGPNWSSFVTWVNQVLGPQGIEGPEWADSEYAVENRSIITDVCSRMTAALDQEDLINQGQAHGLLLLPVQDIAEVAADPHLAARDYFETNEAGTVCGSPFRSSHGRRLRGRPPALNDGGIEALREQSGRRPASGSEPGSDPRQPLAGIRVVDFCWAIAGPLTTRLLASLGAEVIKLESENRVDPIRYIGLQPPGGSSWDTNGVFQETCPNKRAITLNVDTDEGQDLARQLIATADVVTANYTPDRLDRWGLGVEELTAIKPELVIANMAVMGTWGPNAGWRSYGSGIVAMCGLAAHTTFPGRTPECLGTLHTDFTVPYFAALQIMTALHHRNRTGQGSYLELAQYETAVRLLDTELAAVLNGGPTPERTGNRSHDMSPHGVFPAEGTDRWVAIACRDDNDWSRLATLIPGLANHDRWAEQDEVERRLGSWTRTQSASAIAEQLQAAGIPASPVEDLSDFFDGADTGMGDAWQEIEMTAGGSAVVLQDPVIWDGERLPLRPAPMWFEDTFEVIVDELGVDPDRFADLVDRRVLW